MVALLIGTDAGVVHVTPEMPAVSEALGPGHLAVAAVAALHSDPTTLVVAARHDGLYQRRDGGWQRMWEGDAHTVAADPHHPGRVYAGVEPAMVLRSDDGGATWRACPAIDALPSRSEWSFPAPPYIPHVRTLVFHPVVPDTLYAGVEVGGVLATEDGGDTWRELTDGIYPDIHTLAVSRADPARVYACTGAGFYRSTDGGRAWEKSMEGLDRRYTVGLVVMPGETDVVAVAAGSAPPGVDGQVFISRDAGRTWSRTAEGLPGRMARVPVLAAAECRLYAGTAEGDLFRSEDAGRTWTRLASLGSAIHAVLPVGP